MSTQRSSSASCIAELLLPKFSLTLQWLCSELARQYCIQVSRDKERDYRYIEINRALRRMYPELFGTTIRGIEEIGGTVEQNVETDLLSVNDEFTTSLCLVRAQETMAGSHRWKIRFDAGLRPDITVAIRMNQMNSAILDR